MRAKSFQVCWNSVYWSLDKARKERPCLPEIFAPAYASIKTGKETCINYDNDEHAEVIMKACKNSNLTTVSRSLTNNLLRDWGGSEVGSGGISASQNKYCPDRSPRLSLWPVQVSPALNGPLSLRFHVTVSSWPAVLGDRCEQCLR
ncbi:hypothetical protein BaRGS_00014800 [Batillaria attramentaria]|uniref:Uncharacterized protein n=1 Tax=Batillaria attramentaria TaxID=370345 RepID=A0ABD0L3P6_9CAEN